MKQKILCVLALSMPLLIFSQESQNNKGIKWVQGLTWQQIQQKAKKENKYIFMDCYATWCKPCKEMDQKVYTVDSVGDYLNAEFISVKLQMDATVNDNAEVKSWYNTARNVESQYRISAFPSYVFFAPTGEVVSKEVGYKEAPDFIQAARNATVPSKQYFVLLKKYKQRKLDDAGTVALIKMAQQIGDTADYRHLLSSYYLYLHKLPKSKLYTKDKIEFVTATLERSNMVLFAMFYPDGKRVNKVMQNDWYAKKVVDKLIMTEKVQPFLNTVQKHVEPEWDSLYRLIAKSYGEEYAGRNILVAKYDWYWSHQDFINFAKNVNKRMEKYGTDTMDRGEEFRLNFKAGAIWDNVGRKKEISKEEMKELSRTCLWMEGVIRRGGTATGFRLEQWPMYIDTYANLLYKIGRRTEAIEWEEFAVVKAKELKGESEPYINYFQKCVDKMRKGEPTWTIE